MLPALTSLIALQDVAARAEDAKRRIGEAPGRIQALDAQLAGATAALDAAKSALAASQAARRALESECGVAQQRVSKYKDQLMEAKDNRQFHALQHEITTFTAEVQRVEGLILERMMEGDDLAARVKAAEVALAADKKSVAAQKAAIDAETADLTVRLEQSLGERAEVVKGLTAAQLATFEQIFKARKGVAIAQVIDGLCQGCRVRIRPHLYNQLRASDTIIQCESCVRILYWIAPVKPDAEPPSGEQPPAV